MWHQLFWNIHCLPSVHSSMDHKGCNLWIRGGPLFPKHLCAVQSFTPAAGQELPSLCSANIHTGTHCSGKPSCFCWPSTTSPLFLIYYLLGNTPKNHFVFKISRWLGCFPKDSVSIDQEDGYDAGPRCSSEYDPRTGSQQPASRSLFPSPSPALSSGQLRTYYERNLLLPLSAPSSTSLFSLVDLKEGAILPVDNVYRFSWLSQLGICYWHLVCSG